MNVALIKPSWAYPITRNENTYNRYWPPLSLLNCAAILKRAGHSATVIDAHAQKLTPHDVAKRVRGFDIAVVTSSDLDRWQCPNLELEPLRLLLEAVAPEIPRLYLSGFHSTVAPEEMISQLPLSGVLRGEPESSILDLVQMTRPQEVKGLSYREESTIHHNSDSAPLDMTTLPLPSFSEIDFRLYRYEILGSPFALLETVRGCPYSCAYCSRVIQGKSFRRKSISQVAEEVDFVHHKSGVKFIYFIDLEFTASRNHVSALCEEFLTRGFKIKWCCQTRTDQVDRKLLALMKKAGCSLIHFGVESGSQKVLDRMHKGLQVTAQLEGIRLAQEVGLDTLCFYLYGYPGESEADREETLKFAKKADSTYVAFHRVSPYAGTPLHNELAGRLNFPIHSNINEGELIEAWVARSFKEYYLRPSYVLRRLRSGGNWQQWPEQFQLFLSYLKVFSSPRESRAE